jgi:hypothetical protein
LFAGLRYTPQGISVQAGIPLCMALMARCCIFIQIRLKTRVDAS